LENQMFAVLEHAYAVQGSWGIFEKVMSERLGGAKKCASEDTLTMRLGYDGDADASKVGLSSWNRRKWPRWLVANWDSKPSSHYAGVVDQ
jgi:hypothetical protein